MIPLHDDNPTKIFPYLTVAFIVTCVLVFFWQLSLGPAGQKAVYALGVIPATLLQGKTLAPDIYLIPAELTLLTSMFLHGGWMHLIGNMLYLWIFGNNVEDAMGHTRFIVFYIICGFAAALAQSLPDPSSVIPMIGASGAISGVLGAYLLLYPRARVLVAIPLVVFIYTTRLPAMAVLGFWFAYQLISSLLTDSSGGGVAWGAHVGGFIAGVLLIPFFKYRRIKLFN
ncbi:MAG: rhomboid family intramembrane serine protease [Acidiferrobacterales bacterium]